MPRRPADRPAAADAVPDDADVVGVPVAAGPDRRSATAARPRRRRAPGRAGLRGQARARRTVRRPTAARRGRRRGRRPTSHARRRSGGPRPRSSRRRGSAAGGATLLDAVPADADRPRRPRPWPRARLLGAYRFSRYKSDAEAVPLETVVVVGHGRQAGAAGVERGVPSPGPSPWPATSSTRRPGDLTPADLADVAAEVAGRRRASAIEVLDESRPSRARASAASLGVGQGSDEPAPPHQARLRARPARRGHARPGRQGHHVRLRRPVAQDRRRHDDDEERHGRRRRGARRHVGAAGARRRTVRVHRLPVPATENMPSGRGHQARRRAHDPQRQDRRGAQHRRRGPPGAGRRAVAGGRGAARRHRRPGHAHRRLHGGARAAASPG